MQFLFVILVPKIRGQVTQILDSVIRPLYAVKLASHFIRLFPTSSEHQTGLRVGQSCKSVSSHIMTRGLRLLMRLGTPPPHPLVSKLVISTRGCTVVICYPPKVRCSGSQNDSACGSPKGERYGPCIGQW